ncbi:type II toxin-antitoxin system Phd/YefM family antitoxin [Sphingosinicella sp. BN140058]|uniref:type II toxin-antitoxin system Phd/YefM family antitoxin n=1 Tax=Sphingosinicella sp. BN140058 TaxID=1892855 RepID=UPI001011D56B|nr:type II toxin-antitoxin system prevent-host-death family antitoxin [Sphingosinicella sp. BN140058]QAY77306.1 type II toxin-antitoxin system prevent-host-death family antitoxin [Sphingosinicella sp. BN140058]
MGKTIGAAEFKAHCLRILDEIARSGEGVTITKRGRAVAEVTPIAAQEERDFIGSMKGSLVLHDRSFDPASEKPWDAEQGLWEPEP